MLKFDESQFSTFSRYVFDPSAGCYEFRAPKAQLHSTNRILPCDPGKEFTLAGWYDRLDYLRFEARRLNKTNGYVIPNPVLPHLMVERWQNRISYLSNKKGKPGTRSEDIACLRYLIIDIDVERDIAGHKAGDLSATKDELELAIAKREEILEANPRLRDAAIWGCSGNGGWILVRLDDLPNNKEHRDLIERTLHVLAERHGRKGRDKAFIDTNTKNPNRHIGIPGTWKCKGQNLPDRPWRLITVDGQGY